MSAFKPWKILHLELSQGIPSLTADPGYQGIYAVFWWHDIPLGHREILMACLPMPATQLAHLIAQTITPAVGAHLLGAGFNPPLSEHFGQRRSAGIADLQTLVDLEKPLHRLREQLSNPGGEESNNSVSVVVCTRDRPQQLARCLRSLQNLSLNAEILVVDNAPSSEATRHVVAERPGVRYVVEPRPGLSIARNTGIQHSTGEIIAFTDDDVVVHPKWLERLQRRFYSPQVMAVTGLILPAELETEAQVVFEVGHGNFHWGYRPRTFDQSFFAKTEPLGVPVWRIGAGANMAFRRKIFALVGDFDERLGAGAAGCSEDSEFWYRVLAEGWLCVYEPTAVVYHYHRRDTESSFQQIYQYMRGHVTALLTQFAKYGHWGNLRRLFVTLPKYYTALVFQGLLKGSRFRHRRLSAEVLGCLSGLTYYWQHRHLNPSPPTSNQGTQAWRH